MELISIKDKIFYGFFAGILASIFRFIFGWTICLILSHFGCDITRWHDFAGALLYGFKPILWWEIALAEITVIGLEGTLGIGFAFFMEYTTNSHYLFKGWLYGMAIWFSTFAIRSLFGLTGLEVISGISTIINALAASIYGLALAFTTKKIVYTHQSLKC